jgi:hypothetical protein
MKRSITREREESALYDSDFYAWTQSAAEGLRQGQLSESDVERVAEEVADMGKRDRRELRSRMTVLIMHLMKWAAQPKLRSKSTWRSTINEQRDQINELLADSPSLRVSLNQELPRLYSRAAYRAADETGLNLAAFMRDSAATGEVAHIDHLLADSWCPETIDDLFD